MIAVVVLAASVHDNAFGTALLGKVAAADCAHRTEATDDPQLPGSEAPVSRVDRALDAAEHPGTRLCTLCGAGQELPPLLRGFDHITDYAPLGPLA